MEGVSIANPGLQIDDGRQQLSYLLAIFRAKWANFNETGSHWLSRVGKVELLVGLPRCSRGLVVGSRGLFWIRERAHVFTSIRRFKFAFMAMGENSDVLGHYVLISLEPVVSGFAFLFLFCRSFGFHSLSVDR
ncbi:hypothetical protein [Novipirellula maiorica]|uniref:hypothetical protein n=1 Tax=Novipirellula maiorica TaxID=1265734 RepID=UPI001F30C7AB|nr:hypothetical protein [Rhodopirellula maiorica]